MDRRRFMKIAAMAAAALGLAPLLPAQPPALRGSATGLEPTLRSTLYTFYDSAGNRVGMGSIDSVRDYDLDSRSFIRKNVLIPNLKPLEDEPRI